jgi:phosphopantetheinyl transferase (holo-ACP synthase)
MINSSETEKIEKISSVRNQLAHRWSGKEVSYGKDNTGKPISISNNIEKFKNDAEEVWKTLIRIYMIEEEKQVGRVIQKLEDPNTISLWAEIPKEQEENADYSKRFSPSI